MKKNFKKIFVLDTNILLNDAKIIKKFSEDGENLIVLPETVIDELDSKKSLIREEIGFQSRLFGRILQNAKMQKKVNAGKSKNISIVPITVDKMCIHIISFQNYDLKEIYDKTVLNDRKIIKVASFVSEYYGNKENTFLISEDIMCRIRAMSFGVNTEGMNSKENIDFNFIKTLEYPSNQFDKLPLLSILDIDPEHKITDYCYIFKDSDNAWEKYGIIKNGLIHIIDENELRKSDIKPLNVGQMFAVKGLLESYDISIIEAKSGSGKNLLAISSAMRLIDKKQFQRIIYLRNSIPSVEKNAEIGFLPGDQSEKMKIFNHPLFDTIAFIASEGLKKKKEYKEGDHKISQELLEEKIEGLINKYQIEPQWIGELRGRTLSDAIVIIDECQNISIGSLNTILTRIGKNSKVIAIGSNSQIDNSFVSVNSNGLTKLLSLANKEYENISVFATNLEKSVRGPIVEFAEEYIV